MANRDRGALTLAGVLFFALICVIYAFQALATYTVNRIGQDFLRELRIRLFTHYQRMSLSFFERENAGRLVMLVFAASGWLGAFVFNDMGFFWRKRPFCHH